MRAKYATVPEIPLLREATSTPLGHPPAVLCTTYGRVDLEVSARASLDPHHSSLAETACSTFQTRKHLKSSIEGRVHCFTSIWFASALCYIMFVKSNTIDFVSDFTNMKVSQSSVLSPAMAQQLAQVGQLLARLRQARHIKQADAAVRAGLSRNTAYRIEKGDPGLAFGQVLRYLDAISPGATLASLLAETDPALKALQSREATRRVRDLSASELQSLDF